MIFYLFDAHNRTLHAINSKDIILLTPRCLVYKNKCGGFKLEIDEFWHNLILSIYNLSDR